MPYRASSPALADFVQRLPKTETHLHLDGACPFDLLEKHNPTKFTGPPPFWADDFRYASFLEFMETFRHYCGDYFTSIDRIHAAAERIFATCREQNCRYVETSLNFSLLLDVKEGGPAVLRAIRAAAPRGLELRIFGGMCHNDYHGRLGEMIEDSLSWPELDGIDLHGPEDWPVEDWTAGLWERARAAGKYTKSHAGEFMGAAFVDKILDELKPQRIEHGVRSAENPATVARLARTGVALDVCVISNVKLAVKGVPSIAGHPIRKLYDAGVTVTVNSDDPLFFGNRLSEEYYALHDELGFSLPELIKIAANGFKVALVPEHVKKAWLDELAGIAAETVLGKA